MHRSYVFLVNPSNCPHEHTLVKIQLLVLFLSRKGIWKHLQNDGQFVQVCDIIDVFVCPKTNKFSWDYSIPLEKSWSLGYVKQFCNVFQNQKASKKLNIDRSDRSFRVLSCKLWYLQHNCWIYHSLSPRQRFELLLFTTHLIFVQLPLSPVSYCNTFNLLRAKFFIGNLTKTTKTPAFCGYPLPPHDYPYYWVILDSKSKEDKVKVTNLKNLPKFQMFEFWNKHCMWHTFLSYLTKCTNMKWIRRVLLKIQSRHDSVHWQTRWNQYNLYISSTLTWHRPLKPFFCKTKTCLFYINVMGVDVLATKGARASAIMILTVSAKCGSETSDICQTMLCNPL